MAAGDDDPIILSSNSLHALQEFYTERDFHTTKFARLKEEVEQNFAGGKPLTMDAFAEDWNKSQFWYSVETASLLARELLNGATDDDVIAVVSAPSVFVALRNMLSARDRHDCPRPKVYLLEHDQRFSVFSEFVTYDFQQPFKLPGHLKGSVTRAICDPPFLSEDCQTKAALTVRWLCRASPTTRAIVCTGERMRTLVEKLYGGTSLGTRLTTYEPVHAGGLSNEFCCYANFESKAWEWS